MPRPKNACGCELFFGFSKPNSVKENQEIQGKEPAPNFEIDFTELANKSQESGRRTVQELLRPSRY